MRLPQGAGPRVLLALTLLALAGWAGVAVVGWLVGSTGVGVPSPFARGYRAERVLVASLLGAALASAGVGYQAVLRNPLADPYLLGAAGGAALAALLWDVLGLTLVGGQIACAFAGALLAVAVVMLAGARRGLEPAGLILVGVIVNATCGALFVLAWSLARARPGGGALDYLIGGIRDVEPARLYLAAGLTLGGYLVTAALGGRLNALALGDDEAASLGVRVAGVRWATLGAASLVTAAAVALSGPIGFVGLVCPHLARLLVGGDVRRALPIATAGGAGLLVLADAMSRGLGHRAALGTVLPVGVLTALLGGPFFLLLLRRR